MACNSLPLLHPAGAGLACDPIPTISRAVRADHILHRIKAMDADMERIENGRMAKDGLITAEYRISGGVLLRNLDYVLQGYIGGKWKYYPRIVDDWYTNSRKPYPGEVAKLLEADCHSPSAESGPPG